MGNLIIQDPIPTDSNFDKWKVYNSSTKSGTYSVINGTSGQAITDLSYYDINGTSSTWYKTSYFRNSDSTESSLSDAFQPQNEKYATIRQVEKFLRLDIISDTTTPNLQQVADVIKRAQDNIDYSTGHAWRKRYSGTKSGDEQTARYEYYDIEHYFEYHTGRPVYLKHRFAYTLDANEGDALEVWNGSSWENWISTKTEGRGNDFWLDYDEGVLFINARWGITRPKGLRMKYRYGESKVNKTVEEICIKMAAIELLLGESRSAFIPEGSFSSLSMGRRIEIMQKQIDNNLGRLREFQVVSSTN